MLCFFQKAIFGPVVTGRPRGFLFVLQGGFMSATNDITPLEKNRGVETAEGPDCTFAIEVLLAMLAKVNAPAEEDRLIDELCKGVD
jgi:hypothetical protein